MEEKIEGIKEGVEVPLSDNIEITELHCHECNGYIKFALDKNKNGEHVVVCPKCRHEHCRIIKNGVVTGDRWASRNKDIGNIQIVGNVSTPLPGNTPTYYIQVSMDNYSTQGWQTVGQGGSQDLYCQDSWGSTTVSGINITNGTTYYIGGS